MLSSERQNLINPWTSIWTKTAETVDKLKDSNWINKLGLLPYFVFGVNAASESNIPRFLQRELELDGLVIPFITILLFGLLGGIVARIVWVNIIFYFGKIWKGQASRRNIDTVISLSLIPEIFKLPSLVISFLMHDSLQDLTINHGVTIICFFLTFRILIIGLARVQKYTYGISILNLVVPEIIFSILLYLVTGS